MSKSKEYIKINIIRDIENLADEPIFEEGENAKAHINEMISFAKENEIDFWATVKSNCSTYEHERLQYIYEGKDLEELDARTFKKSESKPEEEYFPERDGKVLISIEQAIKLKYLLLGNNYRYYYAEHKNNPGKGILSTQKQMLFMKDKGSDYNFYAAIPKDEV